MYVQIVTYNLNGVSEQDYIDIAHQVASQFAAMGGLQAKVWLRNPDSNSFGAVYFWDDWEAQERFAASDLFEGTYPGFANVVSEGYEVYDQLTRATQPVIDIVEEEAGWAPPPPPPAEPVLEPDELVEEPELDDELEEYEPEELEAELEPVELEPVEVEPLEDVVVEEPEPVVRVTRSRVIKTSPKRAPARKAAARKVATPAPRAAKSTKVIKITKKAQPVRRAAAPRAATRPATTRAASTRAATTKAATPRAARVTKVTKVTKKVGKRPVKAQRAKKLR